MLAFIAVLLASLCLVGALYAAARVPAVSIALVGAVVGGVAAYAFAIADGPHGVPQDVAVGASWALIGSGLIGLLATRPRSAARSQRRAALAIALAAPVAAFALAALVLEACPLYVTHHAGLCFYDVDLLGGWASAVVALLVVDLLALATLLLVSAWLTGRSKVRAPA